MAMVLTPRIDHAETRARLHLIKGGLCARQLGRWVIAPDGRLTWRWTPIV